MKIFVATKNKHKLIEFERILSPMGIEVVGEDDFGTAFEDVDETGKTFEENAMLKAKAGVKNTGLISVADDSGLCVDRLDGAPGIYSARYAGEPANDQKNIEKLLNELSGVPRKERTARFVSSVACVFPDGRSFTVRGECEGYIADKKLGDNGFGYDPIFVCRLGCFATITPAQKDSVSHRGKALELFREEIKKYLDM